MTDQVKTRRKTVMQYNIIARNLGRLYCFHCDKVINFVTRAMSTKHAESEARELSLVLIEGFAEIKRL